MSALQQQLIDPRLAFGKYDKTGKGYLTRHELKCALAFCLGKVVDYKVLKWCQDLANKEQHGDVEGHFAPSTFELIVKTLGKEQEDEEKTIKAMFKSFRASGANKYISLEDYMEAVDELDAKTHAVDKAEALNAFFEIDSNRDCAVTYKDFCDLMKFKVI